VKIFQATLADLPELAALERETFAQEVYPHFFFRQAHDLWPNWLLVARSESGELAGYVLGAPSDTAERAWILSAATRATHRGRGIGAHLLRGLLEAMASEAVREVRLTVHPENPARRLYERSGFHMLTQESDYFGPRETRLVLQHELPSASPVLRTERLDLWRFTLADAPFILTLLNTPGWLQFIGDRGVRTLDDARAYLRRTIAAHVHHGFGLWRVSARATGETVGVCGLLQRADLPDIDVGFAFLPQHCGRGFATEAAKAAINHAQDTLGRARILAITTPANAASLRVLSKLGMVPIGPHRLADDSDELLLLARDLLPDCVNRKT
jgi:[ribosomal protein S5]-alanine N-acetyltransferase